MRVVVCGAGTAGCVVAARLSEDPGVEVVLLEVGPHYRPGRWPAALAHSHRIIKETHDWGYLARAGASPRIVHVPRGRVVGGSSVTNGAIALRGHPEHYDEWDTLVDGAGRVRGLEGLWVMDASVMARVPSANTHLAVIALAERLAARFAGREGPRAPPRPAAARHNRGSRAPGPRARPRCQNPPEATERTPCQTCQRRPTPARATPP